MRNCRRSWVILLVVCLATPFLGCPTRSSDPTGKPSKKGSKGHKTGPGEKNRVAKDKNGTKPPKPDIPPAPTMPKVNLTEKLDATCLVRERRPGTNVRPDKMPEGKLQTLDGKDVSLEEFYGEKLTVVFFWNSENLYSLDELKDLTALVVEPYGDKGVAVVGINKGDTPEVVAEQVKAAGAGYPILLDPSGEYFAKVATERVTRTYLLNAAGTILWFDLEYSSITREDLPTAIKVTLEQ